MFPPNISKIAVAAILLVAVTRSCYADTPKLGFTISVNADGILNPVVTKISVTKVEKSSLAEAAGIVNGDQILQIEGQSVAGRHVEELQSFMKFKPGETRTLHLEHVDGKQFDARLTKPKE